MARRPNLFYADIAFLLASGVPIVQASREFLAVAGKLIGRHPFIQEVELIVGRPDGVSEPREMDLQVSDHMLGLPEQLKDVLLMGFVFGQRSWSFASLVGFCRGWR